MSIIRLRPAVARSLLGFLTATAIAGTALSQSWTGSSSDPAELRYRLDLLDAELQDIRGRLGGVQPAPGASSGGGASSIDVSRLENELARLTGQIEQLQFDMRQYQEQTNRQIEDLLFRVTELEGGDTSTIAPIQQPSQPAAPIILSEQADLDRAKLDIQQGRFDQGEQRLTKFLQDYPTSSLAGEAHYWLGQSQFVRGSFSDAATTYLRGYQQNTRDSYAPDNLLQLGVTLGRLNQIQTACQTLNEVQRQYPNASGSVRQAVSDEKASLACP